MAKMNNKFFEWAGVDYSNFILFVCCIKYWNRIFWLLLITFISDFNWNLGL